MGGQVGALVGRGEVGGETAVSRLHVVRHGNKGVVQPQIAHRLRQRVGAGENIAATDHIAQQQIGGKIAGKRRGLGQQLGLLHVGRIGQRAKCLHQQRDFDQAHAGNSQIRIMADLVAGCQVDNDVTAQAVKISQGRLDGRLQIMDVRRRKAGWFRDWG